MTIHTAGCRTRSYSTNGNGEIPEIIVIGKREDSEVYHFVGKRLQVIHSKYNKLPKVITTKKQKKDPEPVVIIKHKPKRK